MDKFDVQRQRSRGERKRTKTQSVVYSFKKGSEVVRVCKRFFLKTIDISHGPLITALKGGGEAGPFVGEDQRGKHTPANKASDIAIHRVKTHIESFPQIESHYTRSDTRRCYLDQKLSINKMYSLYKVECNNEDPPVAPVGAISYRRVFCNEYNLSFFRPRKDQCSQCSKFKMLEGGEREAFRANYEAHLRRKEAARTAKAADKVRATEEKDTFVSATFDLQSVLQIPSRDVSLMYYSRKLCVYNLCFYSSAPPNDAHCYCWSEVEGGRGSNEIGTCILQWLRQLPPTVKEGSFYSDTCGGQNRKQNVAALLMYAVQKTQVETITHNFLESGHSYMECDSMQSAIECEKKYVDVYTMIDWVSIFRRARLRLPYRVINLQHSDVLDLQGLSQQTIKNRKKHEDGNNVNWLLVKSFRYEKAEPGIIQYRYDYGDDFKRLNVRRSGRAALPADLGHAYQTRIPIRLAKKWSGCTAC